MNKRSKIIVGIIAGMLGVMLILAIITVAVYNYHFNKRIVHDNTYFEYLTEINPEFECENVSFPSDEGQMLYGAFYSQSYNTEPQGLIIWVHGMGVSHENYLAEIEWLTEENYVVFSYDNTGVEDSEGDSLKGLTQAPIDLQHALEYLYETGAYADIPHILIGHSWGGFAVSAVSQLELPYEVDGIISLAGFWKNVNIVIDIAKIYVGDVVIVLQPFLEMYESFIFGDNAGLNGVEGLAASEAQVLMIHSTDDNIVKYESNFQVYYDAFNDDDRFTFITYDDAGHKLTVTSESYERIHDIMHHQAELEEGSEHWVELNEERVSLITDFNYDVMNDILEFCDQLTE